MACDSEWWRTVGETQPFNACGLLGIRRDDALFLQNLNVALVREATFHELTEVSVAPEPHLCAHSLHQSDTDFAFAMRNLCRDPDIFAVVLQVVERVMALARLETLTNQRSGNIACGKWAHAQSATRSSYRRFMTAPSPATSSSRNER